MLELVLRSNDQASEVDAVSKIIDHHSLDLGTERSEDTCQKVMGEGALFFNAVQIKAYGCPDGLIDVNGEDFFVVS